MEFHHEALRGLRAHLSEPGPACTVVVARAGLGKTTLVRAALGDRPALWLRSSELPAPLQQTEMAEALLRQAALPEAGGNTPTVPDLSEGWSGFFRFLTPFLTTVSRETQPAVLVWDDADPVTSQRRWTQALREFWTTLRTHARPVHLILMVRSRGALRALEEAGSGGAIPLRALVLTPLHLREAAARVPGWSPADCVTAYALLGGETAIWGRIDPSVRLSTNISRLLLEPGAPLRSLASDLFPPPGRSPARSLALIHVLARGHREWGGLREAAGVFRTSSELGPYMKGLQDEGIMEVRRSLDAPPRSRSRRYRLASPFLDFWYHLVAPVLAELDGGQSPGRIWKEGIRPGVPGLVSRALPGIVAAHLLRHGGEQLPSVAREAGALWGDGYDMDVAGTLATGIPFYGHTFRRAPGPEAVDRIGEELRQTRYGYGRETRLRLIFAMDPPSHALERRVARVPAAFLLGPSDLVGGMHPAREVVPAPRHP